MKRKSAGQASIVMILLLGLVAISSAIASSALSVSNVEIENTIYATNKARYAAWAGVDELMYRLRARQDFGASFTVNLTLADGATVSATITGDNMEKTVNSVGYSGGVSKGLDVKVASDSSKSSFLFAIQTGQGGLEMEGNTLVTGSNNASGNVYSNGDVLGIRASSGVSGSKVLGSVWAVGSIGGLSAPGTGGIYIKKNAWANSMTACLVDGDVKSPAPPSNCPYGGNYTISAGPEPVSLAAIDVTYWKNKAETGGIWSGDCNIAATNGTDCTGGTNQLGNLKILGNLNVPSGNTITITGPVWVKGDINISQNNALNTAEATGKSSIVVIASDPDQPQAKGRIVTNSNVQFNRNSFGAGLIFVSENPGDNCALSPAINLTSNTATVVFIASEGCINIASQSLISGILAKKIHIKNNSTVLYDPSLAKTIIEPNSGGWAVTGVREY